MKRRWKILIVVIVLLITAGGFLLAEQTPPRDCPPIDIAAARALAKSMPGDLPSEVRTEYVAAFAIPLAITRAGGPFQMGRMQVQAYQIMYPGSHIVIDAAMSTEQAQGKAAEYVPAAWEHLRTILKTAAAIYITHEHGDHLGGLLADDTLYPNAVLTKEQMESPDRLKPLVISDKARAAMKTLAYDKMAAVAPGVVLIKAPGHTPGSQWVFITRADGTELLLVGDSAWHMAAIEHEQGPPRLMSLMLKNDREANACQLVALHALDRKVAIVPGHDGERIKALEAAGTLTEGFKL